MFWKKKTTGIDLEIEDEFETRRAFRYTFSDGPDLLIRFLDTPVKLVNISAGGLAFENRGFNVDDSGWVELDLPIPDFPGNTSFKTRVTILFIDSSRICSCRFDSLEKEKAEIIHKFVLEMQKKALKKETTGER